MDNNDDEPKPSPKSTGDDQNIGLIIGVVIFLLLFFFIVIVFIAVAIFDRGESSTPPARFETGNFLSSCVTTSCTGNLVCDGTNFTCKLGTGARCLEFTDCVTGLICSGLCASGSTGTLNSLCPCNTGYLCVPEVNFLTVCKGVGGTQCSVGTDCVSGICHVNICATGAPNSFPCISSIQCASGNCNNNFCQDEGITTGTQGASCSGIGPNACISFGTAGAECSDRTGMLPLRCDCINGTGAPGTCVVANQGIFSSCSPLAGCAEMLVCFDINSSTCQSGETGCMCAFPYPDPNNPSGTICINGMTSNGDQCFNNSGLGCALSGQCISNQCTGQSVLAIYSFEIGISTNLRTSFPASTKTSILAAAPGPTGLVQPYKMFATSNDGTDTIYLVDSLQGFLSMQYDTTTGSPSPWTLLIPQSTTVTNGNTTTERTLLDVGYNGTTFIVAFEETVIIMGTGGSTTTNDVVYSGSSPTNLSPFNVQGLTGLSGTQFTSSGQPLNIQYIDISPPNDVEPNGGDVLIVINSTAYLKRSSVSFYDIPTVLGGPHNNSPLTGAIGVTGLMRFYFDVAEFPELPGSPTCPAPASGATGPIQCQSYQNIAFIGTFTSPTIGVTATYINALQFSGNVASIGLPLDIFGQTSEDIQYEVFDFSIFSPTSSGGSTGPQGVTGMIGSSIIMLANAYNNGNFIDSVVALSFGGTTTIFPYRISNNSRSVATDNAFYILTPASCA